MKNVSNIIAWTSVDEQIHANAGIFLINKIREEQPDLLTDSDIEDIYTLVDESIEREGDILAGSLNWVKSTTFLKKIFKLHEIPCR
jgi:ribonucleoside-diphosphate reductase beta chain